MAWFVGGNEADIRKLQQKLNELGVADGCLTVDGVYGKETMKAWEEFVDKVSHGAYPALGWIDPLKNSSIPLDIGSSRQGLNNVIRNAEAGTHYFRIDPPHIRSNGSALLGNFRGSRIPIDYNHINIDFPNDPTVVQSWIQERYNHYPLSDDAYAAVKDLKALGKTVRIAGKVLLVAGVTLDAMELGMAIEADLNDADGKLGKTTALTAASIGGRWAGAAGGAKLGAIAGGLAGPAAPIAVPLLALIGGFIGAFGGEMLLKHIVDVSCTEE